MIRIGVAGWDYPDWRGVVYPVRPGRGFDRLRWISRFVDVVEINSTFYSPAPPSRAETWCRRIQDREGFVFTAKSHRSWTHETGPVTRDAIERTLDGLRPLREQGRLGALLIQFPQSFHRTERTLERVVALRQAVEGWPAVVEMRHASWSDEPTLERLREVGMGWCVVDQPRVGPKTLAPTPRVLGPTAYLRLHGRNAANWFRPDAGRDARYDYLYGQTEIDELRGAATAMIDTAEDLFVVQNNHFRGQALVNALQWKAELQSIRPEAPQELVDAYPELGPIVEPVRTGLF